MSYKCPDRPHDSRPKNLPARCVHNGTFVRFLRSQPWNSHRNRFCCFWQPSSNDIVSFCNDRGCFHIAPSVWWFKVIALRDEKCLIDRPTSQSSSWCLHKLHHYSQTCEINCESLYTSMDESDQSGTLKLQFIDAGWKFTLIQFAVHGKWEKASQDVKITKHSSKRNFLIWESGSWVKFKQQEMTFNTMRS